MMDKVNAIYNKLSIIKYGWYDKKGNLHEHVDGDYLSSYRMESTDEIDKNGYAICWDLVEYSRTLFEKENIKCSTIFAVINKINYYHCHSFLTFENKGSTYWFECTWSGRKGIHKYDSLNDILKDIKNHYEEICSSPKLNKEEVEFFEYSKVLPGTSCFKYYGHCLKGKKIAIK